MAAGTDGERKIGWLDMDKLVGLDLSESYEDGFSYALCGSPAEDGTVPQATPSVRCRDYVQNYIWATIHAEKAHKGDLKGLGLGGQPRMSMDRLRVVLADDEVDRSYFLPAVGRSLAMLHWFEKGMGLLRTKSFAVANPRRGYARRCVLLDASGVWLRASPLTSMFTLLVRLGLVHSRNRHPADTFKKILEGEAKPRRADDVDTLRDALPAIAKLAKRRGRLRYFSKIQAENYPFSVDVDDFHHHFGIASFADGQCGYYLKNHRFAVPLGMDAGQRAKKAISDLRAM